MDIDTKSGLLAVIRKEAALCFEVRDAAQKTAEAIDRVSRQIGSRGGDMEETKRAVEAWDAARATLSAAYRDLVAHADEVNAAAE